MALDRTTLYNAASAPGGDNFLNQYRSFMDALIDTSVQRLTGVAGTDTITASAEPFTLPAGGAAAGMKFTFVPAANNTGAATLNISGRGASSIVNADGGALGADDLDSSTRYIMEYDGTNFVILSSAAVTSAGALKTTYDSTDTWDNVFSSNTVVLVELWGAGGAGYNNNAGGGGGGAFLSARFLAGDLASSVTITIGGGGVTGSPGTDGGQSSFGAYLVAPGGKADASAAGGLGAQPVDGTGSGSAGPSGSGGPGGANGNDGSAALYAGGGGAGHGGTGGASVFAGDGGDANVAGALPAGGGGSRANGAGGRCVITVIRS